MAPNPVQDLVLSYGTFDFSYKPNSISRSRTRSAVARYDQTSLSFVRLLASKISLPSARRVYFQKELIGNVSTTNGGRKRISRKLFDTTPHEEEEEELMLPLIEDNVLSVSSASSMFLADGRFSSDSLSRISRNDSVASLSSETLNDNINSKIWISPTPLSLFDLRLLSNIEPEQDVLQRTFPYRAGALSDSCLVRGRRSFAFPSNNSCHSSYEDFTDFDDMSSISQPEYDRADQAKKINHLEEELMKLRFALADIVLKQEERDKTSTTVSSVPPPPAALPPPPPPPPPPPTQTTLPLKLVIKKNNKEIPEKNKDNDVPSMMDVLQNLSKVKLKSVERSSDGTPINNVKKSPDNTDAISLIACALRKKFAANRDSPDNNDSDSEYTGQSPLRAVPLRSRTGLKPCAAASARDRSPSPPHLRSIPLRSTLRPSKRSTSPSLTPAGQHLLKKTNRKLDL